MSSGSLRGTSLMQIFVFTPLLSVLKDVIILSFRKTPLSTYGLYSRPTYGLSPTPGYCRPKKNSFNSMDGSSGSVSSLTLYPPSHKCSMPGCPAKGPMKKPKICQIVVYTQGGSAVPVHAIHLYCLADGVCTYYGNTLCYIQIGKHQFTERKLVGLWVTLMLVGWVSATNCACVYNIALSEQQERDFAAGGWQFGCTLSHEQVWDSFVTLMLMDYHNCNGTQLPVPHTCSSRLSPRSIASMGLKPMFISATDKKAGQGGVPAAQKQTRARWWTREVEMMPLRMRVLSWKRKTR
ncbi:hypothetical protein K438DRAFT_1855748, partial [Mycena galopus ATCC 62051]